MTNKNSRLTPIFIAVSVVIGIMVGTFYAEHFSGNRLGIINSSSNKINALLRIVGEQYVDDVPIDKVVEDAMPLILQELDPHSKYIPAKDLEAANSDLEGKFSGIGISFSIINDTVLVNKTLSGGPAEKVGVMPGDRIVKVNDSTFTGPQVTGDFVQSKLKGKKGTKVKITVMRRGKDELTDFQLVRGDIPIKSIKASYMLNNREGYILISNFGRTTHMELLSSLAILTRQGMKGLVIDLRGNTGGFMEAAVQIANEFLMKNQLIVYTEGRRYTRKNEYANGNGSFQNLPLTVLIDEYSASASEILAGAIQDNDRGLIIGRRSFGKGLVQQPIEFSDGSAIRLTVARYYTPSGRCVQRPYSLGHDEEYEKDILTRYERGEFFHGDSIKLDKGHTYYTHLHRPVYGSSGIMPDLFVAKDTADFTSWYLAVVNSAMDLRFSFDYTDNNRKTLQKYGNIDDLVKYLSSQHLLEKLANYAQENGIKRRNLMIYKSRNLIEQRLYGNIIYNILGEEESIEYYNRTDLTIEKAMKVLDDGESYPTAPTPTLDDTATSQLWTKPALPPKLEKAQFPRKKSKFAETLLVGNAHFPTSNRYNSPNRSMYT